MMAQASMTRHREEETTALSSGGVWPPAPTGQERPRPGPIRPGLPGLLLRALVAGACIGSPFTFVTAGVGVVFFCVSLWMAAMSPARPWGRLRRLTFWAAALIVGFFIGLALGPRVYYAVLRILPPDWVF